MKKFILFVLMFLSVFCFVGCNRKEGRNGKEIDCDNLTITLTKNFVKQENDTFKYVYASPKIMFCYNEEAINKISSYFNKDLNLSEYCDACTARAKGASETKIYTDDNVTFAYAYYVASENGQDYKYMICCLKGETYYSVINFASLEKDFDSLKDNMFEFAKTIRLK